MPFSFSLWRYHITNARFSSGRHLMPPGGAVNLPGKALHMRTHLAGAMNEYYWFRITRFRPAQPMASLRHDIGYHYFSAYISQYRLRCLSAEYFRFHLLPDCFFTGHYRSASASIIDI